MHEQVAVITYLVASVPGWLVAMAIAWFVASRTDVPGVLVVGLVALWVAKDVLMYPAMRRFYRPKPSARRILGATGTAVSRLDPDGFVRVKGELWQARSDTAGVRPGSGVRVRDVRGLLLLVAPDPSLPTESATPRI